MTTPTAGRSNAEVMDLQDLPRLWRSLHALDADVRESNLRAHANTTQFTDRFVDSATPCGRRLYILANGYIAAARDHQGALEDMTQTVMRPHGVWGPVRAAFETAVTALWMLEPDDPTERKYRGLRVACEEHSAHGSRMELERDIMLQSGGDQDLPLRWEEMQQQHRAEKNIYNAEARQLGRTPSPRSVNLTNELQAMSSLQSDDGDLRKHFTYAWRLLSGTLHGDSGAFLTTTDRSQERRIEGGYEVTSTINDKVFFALASTAGLAQMFAMQKFIDRCLLLSNRTAAATAGPGARRPRSV